MIYRLPRMGNYNNEYILTSSPEEKEYLLVHLECTESALFLHKSRIKAEYLIYFKEYPGWSTVLLPISGFHLLMLNEPTKVDNYTIEKVIHECNNRV